MSKQPQKRNETSWKPGQSGNPAGRPRTGLAFAERVRERIDPDLVIDLAIEVANDTKLTAEQRLTALWPLIDRGFIKPPTTIDATVSQGAPVYDFSKLPTEKLLELNETLQAARVAADGDGPRSMEPGAADDKHH